MSHSKRVYSLLAVVLLFIFSSCNKDSESARLVIKLVDETAEYKEVNVDIQGISVHTNGDAEETDAGWVDLAGSDVGVQNLLDFTGGTELTLVDTDFPAGKISQIRLKLGPENSVAIDIDDKYPLETPSGQQSGLKLQVHENLVAGITYEFKLDFDAGRSVIHNGADAYILKPVIRVITEAVSGAIKGEVLPSSQNVHITVQKDGEDVASTYAPVDKSNFIFSGIPAGTYTLAFMPSGPEDGSDIPVYLPETIHGVEVIKGEVTTLVEPIVLVVMQ